MGKRKEYLKALALPHKISSDSITMVSKKTYLLSNMR